MQIWRLKPKRFCRGHFKRGALSTRAGKNLTDWNARVWLPYHSPRKFKHSHAVYAQKNAKDISALRVVSQNLMHSNISITDGVYGVLSNKDVKDQIVKLGQKTVNGENQETAEIVSKLEQMLASLK